MNDSFRINSCNKELGWLGSLGREIKRRPRPLASRQTPWRRTDTCGTRRRRRPAPRLHAALADRASAGGVRVLYLWAIVPFQAAFLLEYPPQLGREGRVHPRHHHIAGSVPLCRPRTWCRMPGQSSRSARVVRSRRQEKAFWECHGLKTTRTCALTHPKDVQRGKRKAAAAPTERDGALRGVRHG